MSTRKRFATVSPKDYDTNEEGSDDYNSDYSSAGSSEDVDCLFDECSSDEEVQMQFNNDGANDRQKVTAAQGPEAATDTATSSSQQSAETYICTQPPTSEQKREGKKRTRGDDPMVDDSAASRTRSSPRRRTRKTVDEGDSLAFNTIPTPPQDVTSPSGKSSRRQVPSRGQVQSDNVEQQTQSQTPPKRESRLKLRLKLKRPPPQCSGGDTNKDSNQQEPPPSALVPARRSNTDSDNGSNIVPICIDDDCDEHVNLPKRKTAKQQHPTTSTVTTQMCDSTVNDAESSSKVVSTVIDVETSKKKTKKTKKTAKSEKQLIPNPPAPTPTTSKHTPASITPKDTKKIQPPKKKKLTFQSQVLAHLLTTMKPFTLKTLAAELRTTDIALNHLMLSLLDKGVVRKKEFGKARKKELYYIDLDAALNELNSGSPKVASEDEIREAKLELQTCIDRQMALQRELKGFLQELSNDDLDKRLTEETAVIAGLRSRILASKGRVETSSDDKIGPSCNRYCKPNPAFKMRRGIIESNMTSQQIKAKFNFMRKEWKARKEKCDDFIDNLADAMEKKLKDVHKITDIVTDQMEGVTLPPLMR